VDAVEFRTLLGDRRRYRCSERVRELVIETAA
jgi:hypothetical protein